MNKPGVNTSTPPTPATMPSITNDVSHAGACTAANPAASPCATGPAMTASIQSR